jgi:hypothetical protein
MFGHRSFLMLGGDSPADILSLIKGGYEILDCHFSFDQAVDDKGKAATRVHSGVLQITLSQLPPLTVIEWALNSRKYTDGVIVMLDANNVPVEKIFFQNATCTSFKINYTQKGDSYCATRLIVQSERLIVGDGITFANEWIS